jgi:hypothetical protein
MKLTDSLLARGNWITVFDASLGATLWSARVVIVVVALSEASRSPALEASAYAATFGTEHRSIHSSTSAGSMSQIRD